MKHTIYYKDQVGRDTKDVLREITPDDQNYIKRVMSAYKELAEHEPRPEFGAWFDMPNTKLPRQPRQNNQHNSPRTFCDGIIDKLNQAKNRRDLSPKQCDGIEALSAEIEQMYEENLCANLEFKNKASKDSKDNTSYGKLFRQ
jgi:hypothetical protein